VIKRSLFILLSCAALAAASGCSKQHKIQIESDTCWYGLVNREQAVTDCGNSSYKILGALGCVRIQKQTANGYLRVRIDTGPWAQTTDSYGIVQVCD
jgi:hypothetical protein